MMHLPRLETCIQRPSLCRYALTLHTCLEFIPLSQTLHNCSQHGVVFLRNCNGKECEDAQSWHRECCMSVVAAPSCLFTHPLPRPHPSLSIFIQCQNWRPAYRGPLSEGIFLSPSLFPFRPSVGPLVTVTDATANALCSCRRLAQKKDSHSWTLALAQGT